MSEKFCPFFSIGKPNAITCNEKKCAIFYDSGIVNQPNISGCSLKIIVSTLSKK